MPKIKVIVNEPKRGCGFRKAGGLYLIGGGDPVPCGKLPLPLGICPACGAGVRPSRSWTWVNAKALFAKQECAAGAKCRGTCVLRNPPETMGLLWIGERFYPSPMDFSVEAARLGVSRRIKFIPHGFVLGKHWIIFAHNRAVPCWQCHAQGTITDGKKRDKIGRQVANIVACPECGGRKAQPAVFMCFRPTSIEYTVTGKEKKAELAALEKREIKLVRLVRKAQKHA